MNYHLRIPFLGVFFFLGFTCLQAQSDERSLRNLFIEAETYFLFEEYKDALPLYQQIYREESTNYNVAYKIGICYLNDRYNKEKSINYLKKAAENINPDCKPNSFKEKMAPPEAEFDLGMAYRKNGYIEQALKIFTNFRQKASPDVFDFDIIDDEIFSCRVALNLAKHPIHFETDNKLGSINTPYAEINPVLSGNGNALVFTRKLPFYDGVFISHKQLNGSWSEPYNLTGDFGVDGNSYTTGISYNGNEILVYRSNSYDGNIYISRLRGQGWSKLEKLGPNVNTKYWESHASPSPDNQYLYFTSNRRGGFGGLDIYKAKRLADGTWGQAENLGAIINSKFDEETPFLANGGNILYFSSQGHESSGGFDVFLSELNDAGQWGKPENIGYPFNTSDDDLFFQPDADDNFGFQARYEIETTQGLDDIYRVEIFNRFNPRSFLIKGTISKKSGAPKDLPYVRINLLSAINGQLVNRTNLSADGSFELSAHQGDYTLQIQGKGVEPLSIPVTISALQASSIIQLDTLLLHDVVAEEAPTVATRSVPTVSAEAPRLEPVRSFFLVSDEEQIPIEILVDKNNYLRVDILSKDKLVKQELFKTQKRKFTYYYTPLPGESIVAFTITDSDSNTNYKEVLIRFEQPLITSPIEPIAQGTEQQGAQHSDLSSFYPLIASSALAGYLATVDLSKYASLTGLYTHLLQNASKNGYTVSDVDDLMAILASQKELNSFMSQLQTAYPMASGIEGLNTGLRIPLYKLFLLESLTENLEQRNNYSQSLLEILTSDGITEANQAAYMLSFDYEGAANKLSGDVHALSGIQLAGELAKSDSINKVLGLAASTKELNFFYQNLLFSADDEQRALLAQIDLDKMGVNNAIDLVKYLLSHSDEFGMSKADMFSFIQQANVSWQNNVLQFINILSDNAVGTLKEELEGLKVNASYYGNFQDVVNQVCVYSQDDAVSREALYRLFMEISGTYTTDSLLRFIEQNGFDIFAESLKDVTRYTHSNPYEVLQHLLAMASVNGYSESDICDMLLYLLLEKGMKKQRYMGESASARKMLKNRSFLHVLVLVNIGIILIILLIILRKRSKEKPKENDHTT